MHADGHLQPMVWQGVNHLDSFIQYTRLRSNTFTRDSESDQCLRESKGTLTPFDLMLFLERRNSIHHTKCITLFAGVVSPYSSFDMLLISNTMSETAYQYICRPAEFPISCFLPYFLYNVFENALW